MKIENRIIDKLHHNELTKIDSLKISNSIIKTLDFDTFEPNYEIIIENSIIDKFMIHACWFRKGLTLRRNQINSYVDYQMGGHNEIDIKIIENIFCGFVNFFDCQFVSRIEVRNNIFIKGTNLLGNLDEGFKNSFEIEPLIKDNIGIININGEGVV